MKNTNKILGVLNNKEIDKLDTQQAELWLRAKIVLQFVTLRKEKGLSQEEVAERIGVIRPQITRFENMKNSPTITFLVKYAKALDTEVDVLLKGVNLIEAKQKH